MTDAVPSYAIAYLRDVDFGDDMIRYLRQIDRTLVPFGGEFIVHGGALDVREGRCSDGALVIIRFPAADAAARWYDSTDYRRILPLRLNNSTCQTVLVTGVAPGHTGSSKVTELLGG